MLPQHHGGVWTTTCKSMPVQRATITHIKNIQKYSQRTSINWICFNLSTRNKTRISSTGSLIWNHNLKTKHVDHLGHFCMYFSIFQSSIRTWLPRRKGFGWAVAGAGAWPTKLRILIVDYCSDLLASRGCYFTATKMRLMNLKWHISNKLLKNEIAKKAPLISLLYSPLAFFFSGEVSSSSNRICAKPQGNLWCIGASEVWQCPNANKYTEIRFRWSKNKQLNHLIFISQLKWFFV